MFSVFVVVRWIYSNILILLVLLDTIFTDCWEFREAVFKSLAFRHLGFLNPRNKRIQGVVCKNQKLYPPQN